jgi:hypothetical protein
MKNKLTGIIIPRFTYHLMYALTKNLWANLQTISSPHFSRIIICTCKVIQIWKALQRFSLGMNKWSHKEPFLFFFWAYFLLNPLEIYSFLVIRLIYVRIQYFYVLRYFDIRRSPLNNHHFGLLTASWHFSNP